MSRRLARPFFPVPPQDYDRSYFTEVIRAFSVFLQQVQNPGDARHTELTLTNIQTHDQGLEVGALFNVDGFVKITQSHNPHVAGTSATGAVLLVAGPPSGGEVGPLEDRSTSISPKVPVAPSVAYLTQ